tara:strand:+ start:138 stop:383 length:246 start_codon:yes stop_codon:yes gene_type:complete
MDTIKRELANFKIAELNELASFINDLKLVKSKAMLRVGQTVWVVQKTKRTPGTITKVNKTRCLVEMNNMQYNVPMTMIESR